MKLRKKKKGSVLLVVVGMFAFISIMVVSVMSMTTTGFKLKKTENARIENFYGADSGLDIAQSEIAKIIKEAILLGNTAVETSNPKLEKEDEKNKKFKEVYANHINNEFENRIDNTSKGSTIYDSFSKAGQIVKVKVNEFKEIKVTDSNLVKMFEAKLESEFADSEGKSRGVKVDFNIDVPDYGQLNTGQTSGKGDIGLLDYLIAADGNLRFNNSGELKIYGDIWINGEEDERDKFERGIHIAGTGVTTSKINILGKLITRGAVNISNTSLDLYDDVFARDIKINDNSKINSRAVLVNDNGLSRKQRDFYVYNDLILNGESIDFRLSDYYGLNDLTGEDFESIEKSSGIIVDSKDFASNSFIKAESLTVLGTAYLGLGETDTLKAYQSGESIVINRNTAPYTDRANKLENYLYRYKNPLHLVDKIYKDNSTISDLNISDKVKMVRDFYGIEESSNKGNKNLNDNFAGIKILNESGTVETDEQIIASKLKGTGVMYANSSVYRNTERIDVKSQQALFAKEVFLRRQNSDSTNSFYEKPQDIDVAGSINWNAIDRFIEKGEIYDTESGDKIDSASTLLFKKQNTSTGNARVASFLSEKTVEETFKLCRTDGLNCIHGYDAEKCKKTCLNINKISDIRSKKIRLVFNNSNSDVIISKDKEGVDSGLNPKNVYIKSDYTTEIAIVISKGSVQINMDGNGYFLTLTGGDLTYNTSSSVNVGSFSQNTSSLSEAFKELFKFEAFDEILGGNTDTETDDSSQENTVLNSNDLIKSKNWELIK